MRELDNIYRLRVRGNFILRVNNCQIPIVITRSDVRSSKYNITAYYESKINFNDNVDDENIYNRLLILKNKISIYKNSYFILENNEKLYCTTYKVIFIDRLSENIVPVDFPELREAKIYFYIEIKNRKKNSEKKDLVIKYNRFEIMDI
jgi:hypothetical protein